MNLVAGDRCKFLWKCLKFENSAPIDLTGATVKLRYKIDSAATVEVTMTITSAASGQVEYTFGVGELTTGTMQAEVLITDAAGKQFTSMQLVAFPIRARL